MSSAPSPDAIPSLDAVPGLDAVALGVLSNILLTLFFTTPFLFLFCRACSQPNSFIWKAVYFPRKWWPPNLNKRTQHVLEPPPKYSLLKLIAMLLTGSPPRLLHPNDIPRDSQSQQDTTIMTDEEIHLRFLALCLRLTLLALLLGLPIFFILFSIGLPHVPRSFISSSMEDFTVIRLLHHYDISSEVYSARLVIWAVAAFLIGSLLALLLILAEWKYLKSHIQRFALEKCGGLQIVYLPHDSQKGFDGFGERKMVNFVRACGLGPVGGEGNGAAIIAHEKNNATGLSHEAAPRHFRKRGRKMTITGLEADPHGTYANLGPDDSGDSFHPQSSVPATQLGSEQRGVIIQGVFTVSRLENLHLLAEERRRLLDELELEEAKYVAGFVPEETHSRGFFGSKPATNSNRRRKGRDIEDGQMTPGPLGLYQLDAPLSQPFKIDWQSSSTLMSSSVTGEDWKSATERVIEEPKKPTLETLPPNSQFGEIVQDLRISNHEYQKKWAIGKEVAINPDGSFFCIASSEAEPSKLHMPLPADVISIDSSSLVSPRPRSIRAESRRRISATPSFSSDFNQTRPWMETSRQTPTSISSTEDSHGDPPPSSTAPTSAVLDPEEVAAAFKEIGSIPPQAFPPLSPQRLPEANTSASKLRSILSLSSSSCSDLDKAARPGPTAHLRVSQLSASSRPQIIRGLFQIPDVLDQHNQVPEVYRMESTTQRQFTPIESATVHAKFAPSTSLSSKLNFRARHKLKPHRFFNPNEFKNLYNSIRRHRSQLKRLNTEFLDEKAKAVKEIEEGLNQTVSGWLLVGKGVGLIKGAQLIDGMTRDDVNWDGLAQRSGAGSSYNFWILVFGLAMFLCILISPISVLSFAASPATAEYTSAFASLQKHRGLGLGLVSITVPSLVLLVLLFHSLSAISYLATHRSGTPSKAAAQMLWLKASMLIICGCFIGWFMLSGALFNSIQQIKTTGVGEQLANSIPPVSNFFLGFECVLALGVPIIILAQPKRWTLIKNALVTAQTPRQRVLSLWPDEMNSILSRGATLMVVSISIVFLPIAPLIAVPSTIFLVAMILVQHQNIRSLYKRGSQTGGKIDLSMVIMLSIPLACQAILVGLLLFSRKRWVLAALACILALLITIVWVFMISQDMNVADRQTLHPKSRRALEVFERGPKSADPKSRSDLTLSFQKNHEPHEAARASMESVLNLVYTALDSSPTRVHRAVPLPSESVDDLVDTRLALRMYPDAPPLLPTLPWADTAMVPMETLYPPVLLQTSPAVWLPKDGVAEEEAADMKKYWDLEALYEESISAHQLNLS